MWRMSTAVCKRSPGFDGKRNSVSLPSLVMRSLPNYATSLCDACKLLRPSMSLPVLADRVRISSLKGADEAADSNTPYPFYR
jgi:hypothetical protein